MAWISVESWDGEIASLGEKWEDGWWLDVLSEETGGISDGISWLSDYWCLLLIFVGFGVGLGVDH